MTRKVYELKHVDGSSVFLSPNQIKKLSLKVEQQQANGHDNEHNAVQIGNDITKDDDAEDKKTRGQWSKGLEFLLSCISMSVGLGNVWRFPYAAYENGGGAFLIPYLLLLFIIGRPMYYMELIMGQFSGRGPIKVWKCVPALKGIGFAQLISTGYIIIFYNYMMALTLYYLFASFSDPLPWQVCDIEWCDPNPSNFTNNTSLDVLIELNQPELAINSKDPNKTTMSELYWIHHVLKQSSGLDDISWINWKLTLCLVGSWCLVYLSIVKGVSSLGKISYFTALFPYAILIALLIAALTRDGAWDGIKYFFIPKWEYLLNPIVWYRAVEQSFFSLAVCFGALVMYSSYNGFRNNVYKDAIIIAVLDTFTSILAGCVIFAVLGAMAHDKSEKIENIVKGGLGLAFVVYPEALTKMFVPQLWSVLFFIMLFTLGIGSSVAQIETILTCIRDEFTSLRKRKWVLALITCSIFCLLGVPLTTNAGTYIMKLLDNYGVGTAVFLYGIAQTIGVMWIYGLKSFCRDVKFMLDKSVGIFWKITWGFTAPVALIVIFVYGNVQLFMDNKQEEGIPAWGTGIGWALACLALVQIPLWIFVTVYKKQGSIVQKIKKAFSPAYDWGPQENMEEWKLFKNKYESPPHEKYYVNSAFTIDPEAPKTIS